MIRVLHVLRSLNKQNAGGIGAFVMNIYRVIDREKIQFDFAVTNEGACEYRQEIESLGGRVYFISKNGNRNCFDGIKQLFSLFLLCRKHRYRVVHCHYYFANSFFLLVAKMAGVKIRVSHCHNTRTKTVGRVRDVYEKTLRNLLLCVGTDFLGCADAATIFLYGEKTFAKGVSKTIYNGIDLNFWNLNNIIIDQVKSKYGINDEHVLLFVGRLEEQKNPIFALKVIKRIFEKNSCVKAIIVGEGSLCSNVRNYIEVNNMGPYTTLLPANSDIRELQAVSEVMIAPSLWEGLSIAFIEAQVMNTIVFSSDLISYEVDMGRCKHLPLGDVEYWANEIIAVLNNRTMEMPLIKSDLFDVNKTAVAVSSIYLS